MSSENQEEQLLNEESMTDSIENQMVSIFYLISNFCILTGLNAVNGNMGRFI